MVARALRLAQRLMRREWRWLAIGAAALAVGAIGARSYARLATPYYRAVARVMASMHPWQVASLDVVRQGRSGAVLELTGTVRARAGDQEPSARVISKLQVAAVVELPVIFWSALLLWPVPPERHRLTLLLAGLPMFLGLEVATTVCQLVGPLGYASAVLAGDDNPVTVWQSWARFLEEGGTVALALSGAVCVAAVWAGSTGRRHRSVAGSP